MRRLIPVKKTKDPALFSAIKDFMKVYAPIIRRKSPNTVKSYASAINLYFEFLSDTYGKNFFNACLSDFTRDNIISFMNWLQINRGNAVTTVNQRLAHIRTFCNYMMKNNLLAFDELSKINDIAKLDDLRKTEFVYLEFEEVKAVLQLPNTKTKYGIRDRFFMALLYDSGCRDQEILDVKVKDLNIDNPYEPELCVIGKGNKIRSTPISKDIVDMYIQYCKTYNINRIRDAEEYLFTTKSTRNHGKIGKMSDDNARRILLKYEEKIRERVSDFPHLHAHLFRRTRAMHLYMSGVSLPLIAEWLGHSDLDTVQIYARATVEMKRKATAKLSDDNNSVFQNDVAFKYMDDEDAMRRLCGLK